MAQGREDGNEQDRDARIRLYEDLLRDAEAGRGDPRARGAILRAITEERGEGLPPGPLLTGMPEE